MDSRVFREAIRSATATYAVPYAFSVLLLFAVICLVGAWWSNGPFRWLLAVLGTLGAVSGIAVALYAVFRKPELLRSESHVFRMAMANIIGDREMDRATRSDLMSRLVLEPPRGRRDQKEDDRHV